MAWDFIDNNTPRVAPDPICTACSQPITQGQEVTFRPGAPMHVACVKSGELDDTGAA